MNNKMRDLLSVFPFQRLNILTVWPVDDHESSPPRRVRLCLAKSLLVLLNLHPSFHRKMAIVFH
jgi:hypothetical protein